MYVQNSTQKEVHIESLIKSHCIFIYKNFNNDGLIFINNADKGNLHKSRSDSEIMASLMLQFYQLILKYI